MTFRFELLDRDGTLLKVLDGWVEGSAGWSHPRRGAGAGTLTIPNDHADFADVTEPSGWFRCVRCFLNPPATPTAADAQFLWVINRAPRTRLDPAGQHREVTQISGDGGLSLLGLGEFHSAIVVDDSGVKTWGWIQAGWDDSGWGGPTSQGTQDDPAARAAVGEPLGWIDPTAEWIGSAAGKSYLRRYIDISERPEKAVAADIYVSGQGPWEFWFDGEQKASGGRFETARVRVQLAEPGHQLALYVESGPGLLTIVTVPDDPGGTPGVLYRSFTVGVYGTGDPDPWKAVENADPTGVTYGFVMSRLIDEAQARGCLPGITYTFTDTLDSDGVPWSVSLPLVSYRDGVQLGDVALQGTQQFKADVQMLPTFELALYDSFGTDRSATVQLAESDPDPSVNDVVSVTIDPRAPKATVARLETEGGFGWAVDTGQVNTFGRRETAATYGVASSIPEVVNAAEALLDDIRGVVPQVINVAPAEPYDRFTVGDTVGVRETVGGAFLPHRVEAISPTEVEAGNVEVDIDVERRL